MPASPSDLLRAHGAATRLVIWVLLFAVACSPARKRTDGNIVRQVHFEGNASLFSGHNDYQLRSQMEMETTAVGLMIWPLMYTVEPKPLRSELLPRDAYRLEVWYAHNGWFDARVEGWELRRLREVSKRRAGIVDVVGTVTPGEPSLVRSLEIEGLDRALGTIGRSVLRNAPIREGDQFNLNYLQETRAKLLRRLHDLGRAYATVEMSVSADPDEHVVDIVFTVVPGILARIGDISVDGNKRIQAKFIRQNLSIASGDPYSLAELNASERRVFEMSTFSIVQVRPDLSDPTAEMVPIRVVVSESKFRSLRFGVGLDYDGFLLAPRISTRFRDVNLFGQLIRFDLGARAGLAYDVSVTETPTAFPTWGVEVGVRYPRIAGQRVALELLGEIEQDVYSGLWAYQRPKAQLQVVWKATDDISFRAGPYVEQYKFLGEYGERQQVAQQRLFGVEGQDDFIYQLTALDQYGTWDWRNDPQRPTRGSFYQLNLREALPLTERGYFFLSAGGEARKYVPVRMGRHGYPLTLVGRVRGRYIHSFDDKSIPLPERAFMGGATSVRGFRSSQAGPYQTLCTYDQVANRTGLFGLGASDGTTTKVTQLHLPTGGNVLAESSVEARYDWVYGIILATFADVGLLSPTIAEVSLDDIRASVGVGMRYDTLIGPFRFDLSFRPLYEEDYGPDRFILCRDPADEVIRPYDFVSNFKNFRDPSNHPPFATVFFLTIGESL